MACSTTRQGKRFDALTAARFDAFSKIMQDWGGENSPPTIVQGSCNGGGVSASAGTHDGDGAWDLTPHNWVKRSWADRLLGGTGARRHAIRGVWSDHIHSITLGLGSASRGARAQVTSYYNKRNGLANNGPDTDRRPIDPVILFVSPTKSVGKPGVLYAKKDFAMRSQPFPGASAVGTIKRGAKFTVVAVVNVDGRYWAVNSQLRFIPREYLAEKVSAPKPEGAKASLRLATYNVAAPGTAAGDLGNDKARLAVIADEIKDMRVDAIAIQEGGPRKGKDEPSDFMASLMKNLGKGYRLIVPTTDFNENYVIYVRDSFKSIGQWSDVIIRGSAGGKALPGKHVTRAVFTGGKAGDRQIVFGSTHLVANNRAGALVQSRLATQAVNATAGERLSCLAGDFNATYAQVDCLPLLDARVESEGGYNKTMSTYQKYTDLTPNSESKWIVDHIRFDEDMKAFGCTTFVRLKNGKFQTPVGSDHRPVVAALGEK